MNIIRGYNAPVAYEEAVWKIRICGKEEDSRNGPVRSIPYPVMLEIENPVERLITDCNRDANPFFHCMEFIWMVAGSNDVQWLSQFNKRMMDYSDDGITLHGAYGDRWRDSFRINHKHKEWENPGCQISKAVEMLQDNPKDRRVIVQMWDTERDLGADSKDLPCNTQIMFRVYDGHLDMLVTNRSNDLIWGMMGSNVVHFTMLQELVALAAGYKIGKYRVVSNNLHVYPGMPNFDRVFNSPTLNHSIYTGEWAGIPLLQDGETLSDFLQDCEEMVCWDDRDPCLVTHWMQTVGWPIWNTWFSRSTADLKDIQSYDWRTACKMWLERRSRG